MLIDIVDLDVDSEGRPEAMAWIALGHMAAVRRVAVIYLETDTWASLMQRVMHASHRHGSITILQIHSHGEPGEMFSGRLTAATARAHFGVFARLRPYFAADGQVFLKGCTVGRHPDLLRVLSRAWRVPVTAGMLDQMAGGADHDRYVGPTVTADGGMFHLNRPTIPRRAATP